MSLYKRPNGYYHWDFRDGERRDTGSTRTKSRRKAEEIYRKRQRTFWDIQQAASPPQATALLPGRLLPDPNGGAATIRMVGESYLSNAVSRWKLSDWRRNREMSVRALIGRLGPDTPLFSLTEDDLEPICRSHEERGMSPRTVNAYVYEPAHALFSYARDRLKIHQPCYVHWSTVRRPVNNERTRVLTPAEMTRLLAVVERWQALLYEFAWTVGLRASEIINLRWSDINRYTKTITTTVKNNRLHTVPISARIGEILDEVEGDHKEYVFTYVARRANRSRCVKKGDRTHYTLDSLHHHFRKACQDSGIRNYRFHDHRHTAATRLLHASNGNMGIVQKLLGHRQLRSCGRYAHVHAGEVAAELEKLHPSIH